MAGCVIYNHERGPSKTHGIGCSRGRGEGGGEEMLKSRSEVEVIRRKASSGGASDAGAAGAFIPMTVISTSFDNMNG